VKVIANLERYIHYYVWRVNDSLRYRRVIFNLVLNAIYISISVSDPGRIRIQGGINDTRKKKLYAREDLGILLGGLKLGSH